MRSEELRSAMLILLLYLEGMTFSRAAREISKVLGVSESTVRWNLRKLRDQGFVICGSKEEKFVPLRLTRKGMRLLKNL
ncbi:hypothetical protein DRN62_00540 [Nanoarchaeota archaeon]|nr:ArsR family transcriptional regulator [Nanoarchaeota archaeon]RLG17672.1 MAG: hypothetical protein DRN62_00540 [Nanoarchaeota archaeon]